MMSARKSSGSGASDQSAQTALCTGIFMTLLILACGDSNDDLFQIIRDGGVAVGKSPQMQPRGETYSDDEFWSLVAYVRSLAKAPFDGPTP